MRRSFRRGPAPALGDVQRSVPRSPGPAFGDVRHPFARRVRRPFARRAAPALATPAACFSRMFTWAGAGAFSRLTTVARCGIYRDPTSGEVRRVARQRFAKPYHAGSNPVLTSSFPSLSRPVKHCASRVFGHLEWNRRSPTAPTAPTVAHLSFRRRPQPRRRVFGAFNCGGAFKHACARPGSPQPPFRVFGAGSRNLSAVGARRRQSRSLCLPRGSLRKRRSDSPYPLCWRSAAIRSALRNIMPPAS